MSHILNLLNEIRTRPLALYVGTSSLSKFADFLGGYQYAVYRLRPAETDSFLADFRDWIHERFHTTQHSWEKTILLHSANEEDAVKRFWELLEEFLADVWDRRIEADIHIGHLDKAGRRADAEFEEERCKPL